MKSRVVYDNNVLFQAFVSDDGPAFDCLRFAEQGRVELVRSKAVMRELAEVLAPLRDPGFPQIASEQQVAAFLRRIHTLAQPIANVRIVFRLPRDRRDEPVLNLAIKAQATHLVTWNERHLGYLMERDTPEGRDFCRRYRNLRILTPVQFKTEMQRQAMRSKE